MEFILNSIFSLYHICITSNGKITILAVKKKQSLPSIIAYGEEAVL